MNRLSNVSKVIIVAVVVVIIVVLGIVYGSSGSNPGGLSAVNNTSTGGTGASVTATSPTQTPAGNTAQPSSGNLVAAPKSPVSPAPTVIKIITPVANDVWMIGTQNAISWNKAGGISGSISLIDAKTKAFIGIILPQVGPNQTSYTWNTRDLLLDRSSALKKDVVPGTYEIKITFDGNNVQPAVSPVFTITN